MTLYRNLTMPTVPTRSKLDRSAIFNAISAVGEPLHLVHRTYVESLLGKLNMPLSEYCFANLYLFRSAHQYRIVREPVPHILGVTYDGVTHAMPLVSEECYEPADLLRHATCIFPVTLDHAERAVSRGHSAHWRDDDSDYIYGTQKMASLQGKILRIKRQQFRALLTEEVEPQVTALTSLNHEDAQHVLNVWAEQKGCPRETTDYAACLEALQNLDELKLDGMMFYGRFRKPLGFLIASKLGDGSIAVHFAKGDRNKPGVYPYMFSRLAKDSGARSLNFEQDLGSPGLRRAKRALDPEQTLRKYRITMQQHDTVQVTL